jgi:hypothetical protein
MAPPQRRAVSARDVAEQHAPGLLWRAVFAEGRVEHDGLSE